MSLVTQSQVDPFPGVGFLTRQPSVGMVDANSQTWLAMAGSAPVSGSVNWAAITPAATSGTVVYSADGADANAGVTLKAAGTGTVTLGAAGQTITVVGTFAITGPINITSTSSTAFTVASTGANYGLQVDESATNAITGVKITAAATGAGVTVAARGSANESLLIQGVGTGIVQTTATTASATVGAFKAINSNASAVGMAAMFSNLSANNAANAAELGFSMNNSTPAEVQFGAIRVTSTTVTASSEVSSMILRTMVAGTMTTIATVNTTGLTVNSGSLVMGSTTALNSSGVIQVAAQPNITSLGTLTALALTNNNIDLSGQGSGNGIVAPVTSFRIKNNVNNADNVIIADAGNVSIRANLAVAATYSSGNGIFIQANSTNNAISTASQGAGSTTLSIGNAAITVASDIRIKRDIVPYLGDALGVLKRLEVVEYNYLPDKTPNGYQGRFVGFTAQQLYDVTPWAINTQGGATCNACRSGRDCAEHGEPWQARFEFLNGLLVKALQDMDTRLARLEAA